MGEHSEIFKAEEHRATRQSTEDSSAAQHEIGVDYPGTRLGRFKRGGRGSSETRTQHLLQLQRTYGNRAVQRQADGGYEPSFPPFLMGPLTMGFDYLLHSVGPSSLPPITDPAQPSVAEMVQQQIGRANFAHDELAKKQAQDTDDAQRALTGLPPDWAMYGGAEPPRTLERPEYDDVSPTLNPWELQELERQKEFEEMAGYH